MKKNRPESCGVGRLLVQGVCIGRSAARGLRIGRLRAEHDRCNGKSHRCGRQPVVGASVVVAGTYTGTTTGADGGFALKAREGQSWRFRSSVCPRSACPYRAVPAYGERSESESTMIEQAVVIGYGTAKKRDLTGSIVNVDAATIANRPASNPAGLVAGPRGRCADHQFGSGRTGSRNPYPRYELDQRLRTALCGGRNVHRQHQLPQCE